MPLKHFTETVLVACLALMTVLTGVVLATLPHLPEGFFPWTAVFIVAVLYPAVLYPLLRNNRADYSFRALHFAPVAMAILWIMTEMIVLKNPDLAALRGVFTWGWSAMPVIVIFILLAAFCLHVIRRRVPRMTFLALLLIPFVAVAFASERYTHWDATLASVLWNASEPALIASESSSSASALVQSSRGEKNLSTSSIPEEEEWREKLRSVEEGKVHSFEVVGPLKGLHGAVSLIGPKKTVSSGSSASSASVASSSSREGTKVVAQTRKRLPKSGRETEALAILVLAAFCGVMHQRARRIFAAV